VRRQEAGPEPGPDEGGYRPGAHRSAGGRAPGAMADQALAGAGPARRREGSAGGWPRPRAVHEDETARPGRRAAATPPSAPRARDAGRDAAAQQQGERSRAGASFPLGGPARRSGAGPGARVRPPPHASARPTCSRLARREEPEPPPPANRPPSRPREVRPPQPGPGVRLGNCYRSVAGPNGSGHTPDGTRIERGPGPQSESCGGASGSTEGWGGSGRASGDVPADRPMDGPGRAICRPQVTQSAEHRVPGLGPPGAAAARVTAGRA